MSVYVTTIKEKKEAFISSCVHCKSIAAYPKTYHHANGLLSCSLQGRLQRGSQVGEKVSTGLSHGSGAGQPRFAPATALCFGEGAFLGLRQSLLVSFYMAVCVYSLI